MSIVTKNKIQNVAILMTDLVNSTSYKQKHGHKKGTERILVSLKLTEEVIKKYQGITIKNLGDGVLSYFADPIKSVLAAREISNLSKKKQTLVSKDISIKYAVTFGTVEKIKIGKLNDIFGTPVDRSARILSLTKPNQILIEESVYSIAEAHLVDSGIKVSQPEKVSLKNYPQLIIREVENSSQKLLGVKVERYPPFIVKIYCDTCGGEITKGQIEGSYAILAFKDENILAEGNRLCVDVAITHKGTCDKSGEYFGWRDLNELGVPELYLDFLLTMINTISDGSYRYSDQAKKKIFNLFFGLYPYVFRKSTKEEHTEFIETKYLLEMGL